ncbi:Abi family protein [Clostridium chromiireducens]|uniref:Abi-like protein n=1 Tax=Clostridium chromiireducens TaxID=225345 RepID=A0A1V4I6H0_9CLOT|nr:Abi family protein [Clostridium chromiireducens]OPJ55470.1 Abi-like protein [Clostridium chromiireducens]
MDKVFKTTRQQMKRLRDRGMNVNGSRAKRILEMENYYNLINGYKDLFIDKTYLGPDEKYKSGTDFYELYALYLFDRELRSDFMKYILEIENNVKSVLSHKFSEKYGHDNYLKISNFNTSLRPREQKTQAQKVGEVSELISNLQREISRQLSKNNPMISHSMLEYGYVPLWVLVNTLTLGTISIFYSYMIDVDQNNVGRKFNLRPDEMSSILFILSIYRNACAHDERFYNLKAINKKGRPNSIKTCTIHTSMSIPFDAGGNPICGKNDLFAIIIIFKLMLSKNSFNKFFYLIKAEIDKLQKQLNTITIDEVLQVMGFPTNWTYIKDI